MMYFRGACNFLDIGEETILVEKLSSIRELRAMALRDTTPQACARLHVGDLPVCGWVKKR
jgi:hypothetical protein